MPQTFVVLQCAFCKAFQVTLDKASKKFSCAMCGQKQSFKTVHAISSSAKDCRKVVQELNSLQGAHEQHLGSDEAAVIAQAATHAAAKPSDIGSTAAQGVDWDAFAEQVDEAEQWETGEDCGAAAAGHFVTALPDSSTTGRSNKRRKGAAAPAESTAEQSNRERPLCLDLASKSSSLGVGMSNQSAAVPNGAQVVLQQQQQLDKHQLQHRAWQSKQQQQYKQQPQQRSQWQQHLHAGGQQHCQAWNQHQAASGVAESTSLPQQEQGRLPHPAGSTGEAWQQATRRTPAQPAAHKQQQHQQGWQQQLQQHQPFVSCGSPHVEAQQLSRVVRQHHQQQQPGTAYQHIHQQLPPMAPKPTYKQQQQQQQGLRRGEKHRTAQASASGGAWNAFVDEDGGHSSGDEGDVDDQGLCCLASPAGVQAAAAAGGLTGFHTLKVPTMHNAGSSVQADVAARWVGCHGV